MSNDSVPPGGPPAITRLFGGEETGERLYDQQDHPESRSDGGWSRYLSIGACLPRRPGRRHPPGSRVCQRKRCGSQEAAWAVHQTCTELCTGEPCGSPLHAAEDSSEVDNSAACADAGRTARLRQYSDSNFSL